MSIQHGALAHRLQNLWYRHPGQQAHLGGSPGIAGFTRYPFHSDCYLLRPVRGMLTFHENVGAGGPGGGGITITEVDSRTDHTGTGLLLLRSDGESGEDLSSI